MKDFYDFMLRREALRRRKELQSLGCLGLRSLGFRVEEFRVEEFRV